MATRVVRSAELSGWGSWGLKYVFKTMKGCWRNGLWNSMKKFHYTGELKWGTFVGEDKLGNKYYQDWDESINRDRWVDYADPSNVNASQIPPEWHSWLHHVTDTPGQSPEVIALTPKYKKAHMPNLTGTQKAYNPPNYILNPGNYSKRKSTSPISNFGAHNRHVPLEPPPQTTPPPSG